MPRIGNQYDGAVCCPKKNIEDIKKIAETLTESLADAKTYFETACRISETDSDALKTQKLTSLTNKPITSGLRTSIPFMDGSGNSTQDFLKKVSEKIHARHEFNKQLASKIANCTGEKLKSDDSTCKGVNSWLENQLPQIARLARYNLALAHHSQNASLLGTKAELNLNKDLDDKKSSKEIPWEPLSPEETRIARDSFKNIQSVWILLTGGKKSGLEQKWLSSAHRKRTRFPQPSISNITQLAPIMSLKNEDFLRQKYLEEGLSLQEIAAETVSSWKTVRRHLLYMNVPLKPEDRLRKEQIKFGQQKINGELVANENEAAAIDQLNLLRAKGQSYREIVNTMNELGVPCRKSGARWHLKTVFNAINRK